MPRPLVLFRPSNSGLASFCACFRYPVLGRSCPYASRHTRCTLVRACLSEVLQRIIHSNSPPKTSDSLQFCGTIDHGSTHLAATAQIRMCPALKTV
ncbi:uncharacterized protein K444DRAFT_363471 [Hyaloscypha bicolor E]|uniref:Uncharacterized protein n=1 Tax=Hyaloscypha bicolor E TaxID=1095630 RepID=A0A2J6TDH7_9HELO|nr:uncharacterized protein K444DRAFT_363471 [Hyaloscypha bicolor E]PMD61084.1 hypothetical protein K444DRAFT_363471 [Hyaloscypha bicolor E]